MTEARADIPGAIGSVLLIGVGAAAFWAAAEFSALGSVFPRSVGTLMVALGVVYLVLVALGRTRRAAVPQGSNTRRAAVALVMLGWGFALGPLGFLPSSAAAMAALLLIANHQRWTLRTALLYGGASLGVLAALYGLFKLILLVPLP
jgi:hypothetical protein